MVIESIQTSYKKVTYLQPLKWIEKTNSEEKQKQFWEILTSFILNRYLTIITARSLLLIDKKTMAVPFVCIETLFY